MLGQIVYNLNGYYSHDKKALDQYLFLNDSSNGIVGNDLLIPANNIITNLGVEAPPGTELVINSSITIKVGRTGIYELDDRITINQFAINRTPMYELDVESTEEAQKAAIKAFIEFDSRVRDLEAPTSWDEKEVTEWVQQIYPNSQDSIEQALEILQKGYNNYLKGKHGVYQPIIIEGETQYEPMRNIIVNYTFEAAN